MTTAWTASIFEIVRSRPIKVTVFFQIYSPTVQAVSNSTLVQARKIGLSVYVFRYVCLLIIIVVYEHRHASVILQISRECLRLIVWTSQLWIMLGSLN